MQRKNNQVVGQTAKDTLQAPYHSSLAIFIDTRTLVEMEGPPENQQDARDTIVQVEVNPSRELLLESGRRKTEGADTP
jgi:hypothetical protein